MSIARGAGLANGFSLALAGEVCAGRLLAGTACALGWKGLRWAGGLFALGFWICAIGLAKAAAGLGLVVGVPSWLNKPTIMASTKKTPRSPHITWPSMRICRFPQLGHSFVLREMGCSQLGQFRRPMAHISFALEGIEP